MDFPSVTFCNPNSYDSGEYVRAVFNNLAFHEEKPVTDESKSKPLRDAFKDLFEEMATNVR